MLTINALSKSFASAPPLLSDLSLHVGVGESASIQGASGCGKSTLLSLIAGFDSPDTGYISVGDVIVFNHNAPTLTLDDFRKQHLGIVFQSYNLFDCFNAWDNIAFTARLKCNFDSHYQQHLLDSLGIAHLAQKPIHTLSGGEQQRCAIARALVHRPALVLADEPTGNLDEATSESVASYLFDITKKESTALVVVTHSSDVANYAQQVLKLHQGRLIPATPSQAV